MTEDRLAWVVAGAPAEPTAGAFLATLREHLARVDWLSIAEAWGLKIGAALLILLVGVWLARFLSRALERALARANVDVMLRSFLRNITYFAGVIVVAFAALSQLDVPMTSLLAVLGAAGLAIGLALRDSLSNFASGVMLIVLRPFRTGDFVQVAGLEGVVEEVRIFQSRLRTIDNRVIVLPNSQITAVPIINFTALPKRCLDLGIGLAYGEDIAKAREVLLSVARAHGRVLDDPAPIVAVTALKDGGISLVLSVWVATSDLVRVKSELLEGMHVALHQQGFSMLIPCCRQALP